MAYPFGTTTFGNYLSWAHQAGCTCEWGYQVHSGLQCCRITAPSGRHVVVVDTPQSERMLSSMLDYLDRRLGLTSPFDRLREP